ncbi:MAG: aminoacetone oxidase family FAD-binding enzyme, partial [bacterium]|nr:aminoacetone oxidase family FAD-binding enzyme [bacterium]
VTFRHPRATVTGMRTAIIGGGAAGLMATVALHTADPTAEIFLMERNNGLGKKVIISGGGRCNVTTGIQDVRTLLTKYPRGAKFLSSAMYAFPPEAVYAWFESHGVPLKTEPDLRVFPQSDDGRDIVRALERLFEAPNIHAMLNTHVIGITRRELVPSPSCRGGAGGGAGPPLRSERFSPCHRQGGRPVLRSLGEGGEGVPRFSIQIKNQPDQILVDTVVLTTGGQAYRHTGSTGDGYAFAISLGHTLTPLAPGLNAFFTSERWPAEVSGLSFTRARVTTQRGKGVSFTGPLLFTHKGVSGPVVFALSSLVAFEPYDVKQPLDITIDLFPDQDADALRVIMTKAIAEHPGKSLQNIIAGIIPKSLAEICVREASLPGTTRAAEIVKKDIQRAIAWLKGIPLHVIQRGAGDEFVTAGGIPLTEVNPSTMESKITPGLYFAGEILDVDGFTGGFNLQASWATGHLAGEHIGGLWTTPLTI